MSATRSEVYRAAVEFVAELDQVSPSEVGEDFRVKQKLGVARKLCAKFLRIPDDELDNHLLQFEHVRELKPLRTVHDLVTWMTTLVRQHEHRLVDRQKAQGKGKKSPVHATM